MFRAVKKKFYPAQYEWVTLWYFPYQLDSRPCFHFTSGSKVNKSHQLILSLRFHLVPLAHAFTILELDGDILISGSMYWKGSAHSH